MRRLLIQLVIFTIPPIPIFKRATSNSLNFIIGYHKNSLFEIIIDNTDRNSANFFIEHLETIYVRNYSTFIITTQPGDNDLTPFNSSEFNLRNHWRATKRRLRRTTIVASENLTFISKVLWIYGPNVSEDSYIFVEISQKSFNTNYGTKTFQRDVFFGKMYPTLIILTFTDSNYQLQLVCSLCQDALIPPPLKVSNNNANDKDILAVYTLLRVFNEDYNTKTAHGSLARLCRIGFRGVVEDTDFQKQLETSARRKYTWNADKDGVILGILIKYFNFTIEKEDWFGIEGNYSGIYINPGGDMPETYIFGRQLSLSYVISEFLLYCRAVPVIPATGWDFLWSPFEIEIWGFILLTGVLLTIYHKGRISFGVDVLWGVLGLPYTSNWSKSKFLSYVFVVLLTLNVGYLSVITSKVIIPNLEADIETPAELFRQGYRFIEPTAKRDTIKFINYWSSSLKASKINASIPSNVIVQVDSCSETHNPICIAKWAGLATGVLYSHKKAEFMLKLPANMRSRCHGVKQPFRSYWVSYYFQGPMTTIIHNFYQSLVANGIDAFWDKLYKTSSVYEAFRKANHSENSSEPPKLSFETPILVVFKAYALLIFICISVFPIEYLFFYITTKIIKTKQNKLQKFQGRIKNNDKLEMSTQNKSNSTNSSDYNDQNSVIKLERILW